MHLRTPTRRAVVMLLGIHQAFYIIAWASHGINILKYNKKKLMNLPGMAILQTNWKDTKNWTESPKVYGKSCKRRAGFTGYQLGGIHSQNGMKSPGF